MSVTSLSYSVDTELSDNSISQMEISVENWPVNSWARYPDGGDLAG